MELVKFNYIVYVGGMIDVTITKDYIAHMVGFCNVGVGGIMTAFSGIINFV